MIDKTKNYFNNQCFIDLRYTTDEKAIFEHFIINHGLFKYLVEIVTNTDCKIKFSLENPKNNLRMKIGCTSYFKLEYLLLFDKKTYGTVATIGEVGMIKLGVETHEALFHFFKEMFLGDTNVSK